MELGELTFGRYIFAKIYNLGCRLTVDDKPLDTIGIGYKGALDGDDVALLDLTRGFGVGIIHEDTVVAYGIGSITASLEDTHSPKIFIESYLHSLQSFIRVLR